MYNKSTNQESISSDLQKLNKNANLTSSLLKNTQSTSNSTNIFEKLSRVELDKKYNCNNDVGSS